MSVASLHFQLYPSGTAQTCIRSVVTDSAVPEKLFLDVVPALALQHHGSQKACITDTEVRS